MVYIKYLIFEDTDSGVPVESALPNIKEYPKLSISLTFDRLSLSSSNISN